MDNASPHELWLWAVGILSGILVILNVYEKISNIKRSAKEPETLQDDRISKIEGRLDKVERMLANDDDRLRDIKKGDRATQRALLALLDHGIDGNNIKQMQDAKEELNNYLIEK